MSEMYKKNSYEFSLTKTAIDEVNNFEFRLGASDFYHNTLPNGLSADTKASYIWSAMSAICDDVGEEIYQNVLNYIDNVSNIDLCSVKALQSMIQILGTKYTLFKNVDNIPIDILKLIDIFSIRKDYLLNNEKIALKTVDILSSKILNESTTELVLSDLTVLSSYRAADPTLSADNVISSKYIDDSLLDTVISSTYLDVLSTKVNLTYSDLSSTKIYKNLSDCILNEGFKIPNKYVSEILQYKLKYNIPVEFDTEVEADKIDAGLTFYEEYTLPEQHILDIEFKRRKDAFDKLEPITQYAYYREREVKEYFTYIENEYNLLSLTYNNGKQYDVDITYIEISALHSASHLLNIDGESLNTSMLSAVALALLDITKGIREARDYLKSHAQRTYMKGTFLLISYIINEYLKRNIYPSVNKLIDGTPVQFDTDDNKITLKEYIDQTQYFNIIADRDDSKDTTLNPEFWKSTGNDANSNTLDNTNIFRPAEKSKLVINKSFSLALIAEFYMTVLNNKLSTLTTYGKEASTYIYDFLSTVFKTGAESTYLDDEGRVMCELSVGTFAHTADVEKYLDNINSAYNESKYVLDKYTPIKNTLLSVQFLLADNNYRTILLNQYVQQLNDIYTAQLLSRNQDVLEYNEIINQYKQDNDNITIKYNNYVATNTQYTGSYQEIDSNYIIEKINTYIAHAYSDFKYTVPSMKYVIINQMETLRTAYNQNLNGLNEFANKTKLYQDFNFKSYSYNDVDIKLSIDVLSASKELSTLKGTDGHFESIYDNLNNALMLIYSDNAIQINNLNAAAQNKILQHTETTYFKSLTELSLLLSTYMSTDINLLSCENAIRQDLDYTNDERYKYKRDLFYKYIGLSVGDQPYYNLTNLKHPSYQIHPCLQNFIETVDFQYPIKSIAGIAENDIKYVVLRNIDDMLDSQGYLLSVWNNPLNSNSDYLTRYEKANHIDELLQSNPTYGWDGFTYPAILSGIGSKSYTDISSYYAGLNLPLKDIDKLSSQINAFRLQISSYNADDSADILRYGLDIYGNSYILMNDHTLWMRYKNHPVAFPALVYKDGTYNEEHSQINYNDSTSNNKFSDLSSVDFSKASYYKTPVIEDFIFSPDRTTILLKSKLSDGADILVHADISQKLQLQEDGANRYYTYRRTFDSNTVDRSEYIASPAKMNFRCFYTRGKYVGGLYTSTADNHLNVAIQIYNKDLNYAINDIISAELTDIILANDTTAKVDCNSAGNICFAMLSTDAINNISTYHAANGDYGKLSVANGKTSELTIILYEYNVIDNSITLNTIRKFKPFTDIGFIPVLSGENDIYCTDLSNDLENDGILKFLLVGDNETSTNGIDFRFTYPMRMQEQYGIDANLSFLSVKEHYYTRDEYQQGLSIVPFNEMMFNEYEYHYIVQSINDASYWDRNEFEKFTYLSVLDSTKQQYYEYTKLANYDVSKYLVARQSEILSSDNDEFIVKPCLISGDLPDNHPYVTGHLSGGIVNNGNFKVQIFEDCEISVAWFTYEKDDKQYIKLDFNPYYYSDAGKNDNNTRNKLHLFLNLDYPGESGYLMTYTPNDASKSNHTFFIKNISDDKPKFVLRHIGEIGQEFNGYIIGIDIIKEPLATAPKRGRKSKKALTTAVTPLKQTMILMTEDFSCKAISFE